MRIINFKDNDAGGSKTLKLEDFVHYRNINIVKNSIEKHGPAS